MGKVERAERQLLYYSHYQRMPRHWNGSPIYHFSCIDVKTGASVTLGACYYNEGVSNVLGGHYYEEIIDATADFDILWKLSDERISSVPETFEEIHTEYQRMLSDGIAPQDINSVMINFYQEKSKTKSY